MKLLLIYYVNVRVYRLNKAFNTSKCCSVIMNPKGSKVRTVSQTLEVAMNIFIVTFINGICIFLYQSLKLLNQEQKI